MTRPRLNWDQFCEIVRREIGSLPKQFSERLENVVVRVEPRPTDRLLRREGLRPRQWHHIMGYFDGVPLTEQQGGVRYPCRIILFKDSIERSSRSESEVAYEIRRTLLHELAHFFGYSEDDLDDFESMPSPFDESDREH